MQKIRRCFEILSAKHGVHSMFRTFVFPGLTPDTQDPAVVNSSLLRQ